MMDGKFYAIGGVEGKMERRCHVVKNMILKLRSGDELLMYFSTIQA